MAAHGQIAQHSRRLQGRGLSMNELHAGWNCLTRTGKMDKAAAVTEEHTVGLLIATT